MEDVKHHQPHTAHTTNPVPLIHVGRAARLDNKGALCDIAPTLLMMMQLKQPTEMKGHSLLHYVDGR
jgi:2,3-bisphosphoglycerate-independent phosphoglycerate mutase